MARRPLRWILRLLPREFRDGYERDLEATFRAEARERGGDGAWALARLWIATLVDVVRTAPGEHVDILSRDVRVAARGFTSRPAHTLTAVTALAVGIGTNVAMFAVADAVLLAPLDYRDASRLVAIAETVRGEASNVGYLTFRDLAERTRTVTHLVAATQSTATFSDGPSPAERVNAMRVSQPYFDMVGVQPAIGRAFTDAEDRPGAARRVAILADGFWRRRFGGDPGVVGRTVAISEIPFVVVGVMPRGFEDLTASRLYRNAEVWFPLGYDPAASFACRTCRHLRVFGRLGPNVDAGTAEAELAGIMADVARSHPSEYTAAGARVTPLAELFLGPTRPALLLLWAGVALLLVVACANVASLQLLRASERTSEILVRAALGVTPARLARQFMTESVLLSLAGALVGLGPAWAAIRLVATAGPSELPRLANAALDVRALGVALLVAIVSGLVFALAPLRHLGRSSARHEVGGAGRRTGTTATWRTRAGLVAVNVALAAVLLSSATLLTRSVWRLIAVAPGFDAANVTTMRLWAGGTRFTAGETPQQIATAVRFYTDVLDRVRALPGVTAAAAVTSLPLSGDVDGFGLHIVGRFTANPEDAPSADRFAVTPGFFDTMRIPLVRGRVLDGRDTFERERVAVINRTAAETLFAGGDPLGHQIVLGGPRGDPRTIVGIVGDIRHHGLHRDVGPQVYVPQAQWAWAETQLTLVVRTSPEGAPEPPTLRAVVSEIDPSQPVTDLRSMSAVIAATTGTRRFVAGGLVVFAGLALLLAVVGLYGALSVAVEQRRLEIGIRLALGARADEIRRMMLTHGLRPVVAGLVAGFGLVFVAARALAGLVFGVAPTDPTAMTIAFGVLLGASTMACAVPAWRAGRVDPARSLRAE
jgi:putative ABC transport system permease protein